MKRGELKPDYEEVFTVTDYYDGPRIGIANYQGKPHLYDCIFDDSKGYLNLFRLTPVSPEPFQFAMEDWRIWERWEAEYKAGHASIDTHPALPEDRERHDELRVILDSALRTNKERCVVIRGLFEEGRTLPLQVKWTVLD
jgi:hypothetical protein